MIRTPDVGSKQHLGLLVRKRLRHRSLQDGVDDSADLLGRQVRLCFSVVLALKRAENSGPGLVPPTLLGCLFLGGDVGPDL